MWPSHPSGSPRHRGIRAKDKTPVYIFLLLLALIIVVYYVGSSSVLLAGAKSGQVLGNTFTGRNNAGQFGSYPNSAAAVYRPQF